jgi:hypothetical protein
MRQFRGQSMWQTGRLAEARLADCQRGAGHGLRITDNPCVYKGGGIMHGEDYKWISITDNPCVYKGGGIMHGEDHKWISITDNPCARERCRGLVADNPCGQRPAAEGVREEGACRDRKWRSICLVALRIRVGGGETVGRGGLVEIKSGGHGVRITDNREV